MTGIIFIVAMIVLLLVVTPTGNTILGALKNLLIADAMTSPAAARAVFLKAIEDASKRTHDVGKVYQDLTGRLMEIDWSIKKETKNIEDAERKCSELIRNGAKDNDIAIFVQKREDAMMARDHFDEMRAKLVPQIEQAREMHSLMQEELKKLRMQKELKIAELEMNKALDDTLKKLNKVDNSTTTQLLEQFDENLKSLNRSAKGGMYIHENKIEAKERELEKRMASRANIEFINSLRAQYADKAVLEK